ncbi:reverse transcriptase family protein [Saccharospirillum mangrovi]|uniref:reverse transcriptase family protein n=1 Tax=Saccharospirillum mangrovi TaxID=2161747 RepID=UPI000D36189A|nr:reverse transcriptase family protein [Saccharospirillum mangrovi]
MFFWSPQRYQFEGEKHGIDDDSIAASVEVIKRIQSINKRLPIVLTLRHLSWLTDINYGYLRKVVSRESGKYKRVLFKKKVPGRSRYREIHIPEASLLTVQKWITAKILSNTNAHPSSFAYHPDSQPIFAASRHCGCKWLLKIDIENFFHSISERMVYKVFRDLGYTKLLSFELARITTTTGLSNKSSEDIFRSDSSRWPSIPNYYCSNEGFLPQGAPSSPMLSNLVMKAIDKDLEHLANCSGFTYTRYADDLAFSTEKSATIVDITRFKKKVNRLLIEAGFNPNKRKTAIRGPGARRIILGILVDSTNPRLSKEYKDQIRQHLYYLCSQEHGPSKHAEARKLSVSTLFHHVRGKIAWAKKVEPEFGALCLEKFESISWPPLDKW